MTRPNCVRCVALLGGRTRDKGESRDQQRERVGQRGGAAVSAPRAGRVAARRRGGTDNCQPWPRSLRLDGGSCIASQGPCGNSAASRFSHVAQALGAGQFGSRSSTACAKQQRASRHICLINLTVAALSQQPSPPDSTAGRPVAWVPARPVALLPPPTRAGATRGAGATGAP
jgi:hypothetical protein